MPTPKKTSTLVGALRAGLRAAAGVPLLLVWLWGVNFAMALPAAWVLAGSIEESIGSSLAHEKLRAGFDMDWFGEYADEARGIEQSFGPSVVGAGPFYDNLESWLTGELFEDFPGIVGLGLIYAIVWTFLLGGVIGRFASTAVRWPLHSMLESGGQFFFRFLRLALMSGLLYFLVYKLHHWLFEWLDDRLLDVTAERTVLVASLALYTLTALLLTLVHVCFGYAKIATVVDGRRSMFFAAVRGVAFVLAHPLRTLGLYYAVVLITALALAFYAWIAPGAGQATAGAVLLAFLVGQLFLAVKLYLRVSLWAGQTALYRGSA